MSGATLIFAQRGARTDALCRALEAAALKPLVVGDDERLSRELACGPAAVVFSCLDAPAVAPGDGPEHAARQVRAVHRELVERPLSAFAKIEPSLSGRALPVVWLTPAMRQGASPVDEALAMAAVTLQSWTTLFAAQHAERGMTLTALSPGAGDLSREVAEIRRLVLAAATPSALEG